MATMASSITAETARSAPASASMTRRAVPEFMTESGSSRQPRVADLLGSLGRFQQEFVHRLFLRLLGGYLGADRQHQFHELCVVRLRRHDDSPAGLEPAVALYAKEFDRPLYVILGCFLRGVGYHFLQIGRQLVEPDLADHSDRGHHPMVRLVYVFRGIPVAERREYRQRTHGAVERPLLHRRQDLAKRHRHRRAFQPAHLVHLHRTRKHPYFQAFEVGELPYGCAGDDHERSVKEHADALEALVGAEGEESSLEFWGLHRAAGMRAVLEQAGGTQQLVARIDAGKEFGRSDPGLD